MNLYSVKIEEFYNASEEGEVCTTHEKLVIANSEHEAIDFTNKEISRYDNKFTRWKSKAVSAYKICFEKVNRKRVTDFYINNNK